VAAFGSGPAPRTALLPQLPSGVSCPRGGVTVELGRGRRQRPPPIFLATPDEIARDPDARVVYANRTTVERRLTADDVASVPFGASDLADITGAISRRVEKRGLDDPALPMRLRIEGVAATIHRELFARFGATAQYPRICDVATAVGQLVFDRAGIEARSMWTRDLHHFLEVGPPGDRVVVDPTFAQFEVTPLSRLGHAIARGDLDRVEAEADSVDLARLTDVERAATLGLLDALAEGRERTLSLERALLAKQHVRSSSSGSPQAGGSR
jgi:hypothetical protein